MRFCIAAAGLLVSASVLHADGWNKSFVMKNNEPVIAGSKVLKPGAHVWKLLRSESNRHIVQITDQRTGAVETTILAIPSYRSNPSAKNIVQYWETPKGYPQAVRSWFYPGDNYGQEFAYPKRLLAAWRPLTRGRHHSYPVANGTAEQSGVLDNDQSHLAQKEQLEARVQPQAGSWAVIDAGAGIGGKHSVRKAAKPVASNGFWDGLKRLPKTATLAPLIGLIGAASLGLWLFTSMRRKNRKLYTVGDDTP